MKWPLCSSLWNMKLSVECHSADAKEIFLICLIQSLDKNGDDLDISLVMLFKAQLMYILSREFCFVSLQGWQKLLSKIESNWICILRSNAGSLGIGNVLLLQQQPTSFSKWGIAFPLLTPPPPTPPTSNFQLPKPLIHSSLQALLRSRDAFLGSAARRVENHSNHFTDLLFPRHLSLSSS